MFRIIQDRILLARPSRVLDHRPLQIFVGELAQGEDLAGGTLFFELGDELALADDRLAAGGGIERLADPPAINSAVSPPVFSAAVEAHHFSPLIERDFISVGAHLGYFDSSDSSIVRI